MSARARRDTRIPPRDLIYIRSMRIAAISDVHGNVFALEAVLADIEDQMVDVIVNLGDHLSGGVAPVETADRLLEIPAISIRGNHERQVLENDYETLSPSDRLAHDVISERHREWLANLPTSVQVAPGVLAFHGAPDDDVVYLLESVRSDGAHVASMSEVISRLGSYSEGYHLLLCGHTHLQRAMLLPTGTLVANPGSVGWPAFEDNHPYYHVIEAGTPHARYAVLDDAAGRWEVEFRSVVYPWELAAEMARANGREDIAHSLLTGRVAPRFDSARVLSSYGDEENDR